MIKNELRKSWIVVRAVSLVLLLLNLAQVGAQGLYPKPSYEWIGTKSTKTYYCGGTDITGNCNHWIRYSAEDHSVFGPSHSWRGRVVRTTYHPDWFKVRYGFSATIHKHYERRDGTTYVETWAASYQTQEPDPNPVSAKAPSCKGTRTMEWPRDTVKVVYRDSPKVIVRSSPNQIGSVTWDLVFQLGGPNTCRKSTTLSGPNRHSILTPCTSYWFSGYDCYGGIEPIRR